MRLSTISLLALTSSVLAAEVKIEVTKAVECERKTQVGDKIHVHYRGNLEEDGKVGKEFDASYKRGSPLSFVVGKGSVIKGWDDNLLDMCIGEKRVLTIPPEFGYGDRAMGPIPAKSTLIFETELMGIDGVPKPETIIEKTSSSDAVDSATDSASSLSDKATEKATEAATGGAQRVVDDSIDGKENGNAQRVLKHGHEAPHSNGHEL
ncbi:Bcfpr2 [Botrytis cinerea B05.10]|uniref:peptidylprolyl isomerase n=1 Tax=Botryotinia fuckeliana (strain B05.10) TaxID=332648 RepID=A0A384J438_BOTFB|nr:Bcfpr2 [Botrytis cinerea B05.10]ATZ45283.1 Bcfpr2 [Botrytis cinerea B05.10]